VDAGALALKSIGSHETRWGTRHIGLIGKWAAIAWDLYEGYGFVTKGDNLGDMAAIAGEWAAGRTGLRMGLRVVGGAVAIGWTMYESFQFGLALGAEMEASDMREKKLQEAYFSFMNRALWVPYGSSLADERAEANEFNVSRPKGLKDRAGGQIRQIEQEINGDLYRYATTWELPGGAKGRFESWLEHNPSVRGREIGEYVLKLLRDSINSRLAQIDQINLDMNNWLDLDGIALPFPDGP
jgi:hypothetical protein